MGELCQKMELDLKLRNLAKSTREQYLACCRRYSAYHMRSPREMGVEEAKEFLGHLLVCGGGVGQLKMHVAGLRFLYGITLGRPEVAEQLPWPKVPSRKPDILSPCEVEELLVAATESRPEPSVAAMTTYAGGLRISETCRLKPTDIDSKRMLIHVRLGKGGKDRYVMLSPRLLEVLRAYWTTRPSSEWLFPGRDPKRPLSEEAVRQVLTTASKKVGIKKKVTPHLLRHCFATHLLEAGKDIRVIQVLLGHSSIRTTAHYTQVSTQHIGSVQSPFDRIRASRLHAHR
jgi:integrase/recombinase XerD